MLKLKLQYFWAPDVSNLVTGKDLDIGNHYCYLTNIKCVLVSSNLSDSTPEVYPETLSPRFPCRNSCLGSNSLESDLEIIPMKMIY